jgi:methylaspartate ammonia-lyase
MTYPLITTVIALRSRATSYRLQDDSSTDGADLLLATAVPVYGETIAIGLTLSDGPPVWAECSAPLAGDPPLEQGLLLVQEVIRPLLQQQPLGPVANVRQLLAAVDRLTIPQTIIQERPAAAEEVGGPLSRRELFTGRLAAAPPVEEVVVERPLPAYLRLGIGEALLRAAAQAGGQTVAQLVRTAFNFPASNRLVPIQLTVGANEPSQVVPPLYRPAAQSYLISRSQPESRLGTTGERLQRFVRQWRQDHSDDYRPALCLDLGGALGQLTGHNMGRLLGMLYGLMRVVEPLPLTVVDPVLGSGREDQIALLADLRQLLEMRQMNIQLLARHWLRHQDDVAAYLRSGVIDGLHLEPLRLGSWLALIEGMIVCQERETAVTLGDSLQTTSHSLALLAQIAAVGQPDLVVAPLGQPHTGANLHNVILRTTLEMV